VIYLELFINFFKIGLMSFGGGYAAITLMQQIIVEQYGYLTMEEFVNLITIAEMTPGPIALNSSTFVGTMVGGIPGALIATLGCVLPSLIIVTILAVLFNKYKNLNVVQGILSGLKPMVVAFIVAAALNIFIITMFGEDKQNFNYISAIIFVLCLFTIKKFKTNPIFVMIGAGVIGVAVHFIGLQ